MTSREIRLARVFAVVLLLFAVAEASRAATSAEVEHEIASAFERSEFTSREQWALAGMVLADIAGNESTIDAIGRGCRESNPLYGSRPGWKVEWFAYVRGALSAHQAWSNYRTEC